MAAVDLTSYRVSYNYIQCKDGSGNVLLDPPITPKDVFFTDISYKTPPGKPPQPVAILIAKIVRSFVFWRQGETSSEVELKLRISRSGIQIAPWSATDLPENSYFDVFINTYRQHFQLSDLPEEGTTVDLNIIGYEPKGQPMGRCTGYMRYPHIYADWRIRCAFDRFRKDVEVCIIGPGLLDPRKENSSMSGMVECPQFVETLSLFTKGRFTLLDNDPMVLSACRKSFIEDKCAYYDPSTCCILSATPTEKWNSLAAPESYQPVLNLIKGGLVELVDRPEKVKKMFTRQASVQMIKVKTDPEKIRVIEHDILSTPMTPPGTGYDIIIATHSIGNAYANAIKANQSFDPTHSFTDILSSLKSGGALYLDTIAFKIVVDAFQRTSKKDFYEVYVNDLEKTLKNKIKIEKISHRSFYPESDKGMTISKYYLLNDALTENSIGCSSVTLITRTFDPA